MNRSLVLGKPCCPKILALLNILFDGEGKGVGTSVCQGECRTIPEKSTNDSL